MSNTSELRDYYASNAEVVSKENMYTADGNKVLFVTNPSSKKKQGINLDSKIKHIYLTGK